MLSRVGVGNLMTGVGFKPQPARTPAITSNNTAIMLARQQEGRRILSTHSRRILRWASPSTPSEAIAPRRASDPLGDPVTAGQ